MKLPILAVAYLTFSAFLINPAFAKKKAKAKPAKDATDIWLVSQTKSLMNDAPEYFAMQVLGRANKMSISCYEGKVKLLFSFDELLFDVYQVGYRFDKDAAIISVPNSEAYDGTYIDGLAWTMSSDSKSMGLWDVENVTKFSENFKNHAMLTVEIKHKYGAATAIFLLRDAAKHVGKAIETCKITEPSENKPPE